MSLQGKITREILEDLVKLVQQCRIRFDSSTKFTPKPKEWILLVNSAPDLHQVKSRIIAVAALGIVCKDIEDLARKAASKPSLTFLSELVALVEKHKSIIFQDPNSIGDIKAWDVLQLSRGPTVEIFPVLIQNYEICLKPQPSMMALSQTLQNASLIWMKSVKDGMLGVKSFLMQKDSPQLFSGRPIIDGKQLQYMVKSVMSTAYGLKGGTVVALLKELIDKKIVSADVSELTDKLQRLAEEKANHSPETRRFDDEALSQAGSMAQAKPKPNRQGKLVSIQALKQLFAYLQIPHGCNIFKGNIDFNDHKTREDINHLLRKTGSMRELIIALSILQMQGVRAASFGDLLDKVENSEVQMFRQKLKGDLQAVMNPPEETASEELEDQKLDYQEDPECELWKIAYRKKDNKPYYWNTKTNKTKWKKPKCLRERDAYLERKKLESQNAEKTEKVAKTAETKSPPVKISESVVSDILYAGRLRTMAILPTLQRRDFEPKIEVLTKIVEEGVMKLFKREIGEMKETLDFLKTKPILTQNARLRPSQLFRLMRAGLYTNFGINGGHVTELLENLHSSGKRYRKFSDLIKATKNYAIQIIHDRDRIKQQAGEEADAKESMTGLQDHDTITLGPGPGTGREDVLILGPSMTDTGSSIVNLNSPAGDIPPALPPRDESVKKADFNNEDLNDSSLSNIKPDEKDSDTKERTKRRKSKRISRRKIKWKKVKELGRGAFGVVIWGIDIRTGQSIAIKQIRLKSKQDIEKAKEVEHEVRTLKTLSHPNIVELYAVERNGSKLNIIMEYVPSNSIDWVIKKIGKLDDHYMARVAAQVLEALNYCHMKGLIHRDIKGKNILVDNFGNAKLADFGSALLASDSEMQKENAEYTPLWAAPEMVKGDGKYTTKVDIWSLGCTVVEMASGKEPWSECNFANPFMALYSIGHTDKIPEIPTTMSKLGHEFASVCLTRDPGKRPSAAELRQHAWIKDVLDEEDTDAEDEAETEDIFRTR
ncbi:hypothetical protein AAMO2058_001625700 [Amorphochlora amoebiformis]